MTALVRKLGPEFARFFVVGIAATLVHLLVYWLLNAIFSLGEKDEVALNVTYTIGYAVSFVGNYVLSLKWTFRTEGSVSKGAGFAFSHLVNYGLHMGLLNLFLYLGLGRAMVAAFAFCVPFCVASFPVLADPAALLPLPVYVIVVPTNFLLVRFFLTRGDEKMLD